MAMKNITMRIDESLKEEAEKFFEDLGMSMTTAYTIFLKQSLRKQKFPFEIEKTVTREGTLEEQIIAAIRGKNQPAIMLETDGNGNIIIDKERNPDFYDWAVNG